MSRRVKNSKRRSESQLESPVNQSETSMQFWGICCESGKHYAQVVGERFRVTMAVLDPKSSHKDAFGETVSLIVVRAGIEYLLCVLKHGEIHQVNLNLIFDKGENVKFYIHGHGKVYLSGYQLANSESDINNDEPGYLFCPLVEIKSKSNSGSPEKSQSENAIPRNKKSKAVSEDAEWATSLAGEIKSSDEDDDEDFSAGDVETESDDESISDEIDENELIQDEVVEDELVANEMVEEGSAEDSESDDDEIEERQNYQKIQESRKRRRQVSEASSQKRSRKNTSSSSSSSSNENFNEVTYGENNVSENNNSSILRTPRHKMQGNDKSVLSEKKSKKKLSEISMVSDIPAQRRAPFSSSTPVPSNEPVTPNGVFSKSSRKEKEIKTLEGGVEIQDVELGRGPIATKKKMLHVYFIGRLPDKSVFDSRLPTDKPFSFKLGERQVIKGWDVGLEGMRVGGKRKLKIPPNMGYGKNPPEGVSPKSTLYYVVDLQNVS